MNYGLYLLLAAALATPARLLAQTPADGKFQRLPSGIEYQLFKKENGQYTPRTLAAGADPTFKNRQGKYLLAHITYLTGKDSVLQSSRQQFGNRPVPVPLQPVAKKGGQEEALALVQPGDSAIFRFPVDSLFKPRPVPPALKRGGNVLVLRVIGVNILTEAEALAMQQELQQVALAEQKRQLRAYSAGHLTQDNAQIAAYAKAHQLPALKQLPEGTWYAITQRGTGALPKLGEVVSVRYRGTLLNGREFDSSAKHGPAAFSFALGRGQVIPGWDEGIAALPKGSKAILLIPSPLAYGASGSAPTIPANAVLRFDVELLGPAAKPLDWVHTQMQQGAAAKKPAAKKSSAKQ